MEATVHDSGFKGISPDYGRGRMIGKPGLGLRDLGASSTLGPREICRDCNLILGLSSRESDIS